VKSRFGLILVTLLAVTVIAVAMGYAGRGEGCGDGQGKGHGRGHAGLFGQLTEEHREAIHEKIEEMREAGASREEIHAAVGEMMGSWGIEMPERPGREGRECDGEHRHRPPFLDQLSEEQAEALRAMVDEMKEAGASREEIRTAVHEMLEGWGIEIPEGRGEHRGRRGEIFKQLTEEQRAAIRVKVEEMRKAEATREEIHAAIREMLEGFGIELPEGGEGAAALEALEGENVESATWGKIKGEFK
jgi:DNA-binding transcriptional regulator YhcF (GntR family)